MKQGTMYGRRLKAAYHRWAAGRVGAAAGATEPDDPLRRMAIAILGVGSSDEAAARALERALGSVVDWNEMRVSNAIELSRAIGNSIPHALQRCQQLLAALQSVFLREHRISLERLNSMGRREARQYLEKLDGVDAYAVASVILWSLGGHAIPVNDRLLGALREAELVHPEATREEVQAFLERHIAANDAKRFCLVMQSFTPAKRREGGRTKVRTSRERKTASK
jgi:endonuclease III